MTTQPENINLGVGWNFISALDVSQTMTDVLSNIDSSNTIEYDHYNIYYIDASWNSDVADTDMNWTRLDASTNFLNPNLGYCVKITSIEPNE